MVWGRCPLYRRGWVAGRYAFLSSSNLSANSSGDSSLPATTSPYTLLLPPPPKRSGPIAILEGNNHPSTPSTPSSIRRGGWCHN